MPYLSRFFLLYTVPLLSISLFAQTCFCQTTSTFNQNWLNCVVSLEIETKDSVFTSVGTGFLVESPQKYMILVTAKHVITDGGQVRDRLAYRLNDKSDDSVLIRDKDLEEQGMGSWFLSEKHDLACRFVVRKGSSEVAVIPMRLFLPQEKVAAGAPLMVLGFPLGLRSTDHAWPIVRRGMVARSGKDGIIADLQVYPGNSGGPVLYVPPAGHRKGAFRLVSGERLVGLVYALIAYREAAISKQTGRPRVIFEENSGLAKLVSADAIMELIMREDVQEKQNELPTFIKEFYPE